MKATQSWCARCRFKGRGEFLFGTVVLPKGARHDEVEKALVELWYGAMPCPKPDEFDLVPGMLIFQEGPGS